jgi:predicted SAM-dependent methyltransferase
MTSKLEIGSGQRPAPGYIHNDINPFDGVDLVCHPWEIALASESIDEVLALGVIEHLTYAQVNKTLANVHRMLRHGGEFRFDVPDLPTWCRYAVDHFDGKTTPFTIEHILATLYGWQRWPGDEHKSGWYHQKLAGALEQAGFGPTHYGVELFRERGIDRNRMSDSNNAHIYCVTSKP